MAVEVDNTAGAPVDTVTDAPRQEVKAARGDLSQGQGVYVECSIAYPTSVLLLS